MTKENQTKVVKYAKKHNWFFSVECNDTVNIVTNMFTNTDHEHLNNIIAILNLTESNKFAEVIEHGTRGLNISVLR